ncbi:MAG TPA: nitroreductase family protein [bacterium]|nr:nitroreductase family protein [bacterium]
MELFEAISRRRSIRQFDPEAPVGDEEVARILEAGIAAPSAGNGQCWRFVVVRDAEVKRRLAYEAGHQRFIDRAPVAIVVCADLPAAEKGYGERGRSTYALQETAAAIQNMLLAVTAMGLGSCWIGAFNESVASEILGLPDEIRPLAIIPVGHPAEPALRVPPRRKIGEIATFR